MEHVEQRAYLRIVFALLEIEELQRGFEAHVAPDRDFAGGRGFLATSSRISATPSPATTSDRITASLSASTRMPGELPRSLNSSRPACVNVLIGGAMIHGIATISSHDACSMRSAQVAGATTR